MGEAQPENEILARPVDEDQRPDLFFLYFLDCLGEFRTGSKKVVVELQNKIPRVQRGDG